MSREIDIEKATKYLIDYWRTYPEQRNYLNYMDKTFIHDALYGLGKAIDADRFHGSAGYSEFKLYLSEFLKSESPELAEPEDDREEHEKNPWC